jgi:hypothetical protein
MSASVHSVLVQGADVVAAVILPIEKMSEEAQESRNKYSSTSVEIIREKYLVYQRMKTF